MKEISIQYYLDNLICPFCRYKFSKEHTNILKAYQNFECSCVGTEISSSNFIFNCYYSNPSGGYTIITYNTISGDYSCAVGGRYKKPGLKINKIPHFILEPYNKYKEGLNKLLELLCYE